MYYKEEMTEIEAVHKERAGIKTKLTVKKRKKEPSPRKTAEKKVSAVEVLSRVEQFYIRTFHQPYEESIISCSQRGWARRR